MVYRVAAIFFISFTVLSGCASLNKTPPELQQHRQEALARWNQCLQRASEKAVDEPIQVTSDLITGLCEGHRRDVLLTYPASMERELDALLIRQGLRVTALRIFY